MLSGTSSEAKTNITKVSLGMDPFGSSGERSALARVIRSFRGATICKTDRSRELEQLRNNARKGRKWWGSRRRIRFLNRAFPK